MTTADWPFFVLLALLVAACAGAESRRHAHDTHAGFWLHLVSTG